MTQPLFGSGRKLKEKYQQMLVHAGLMRNIAPRHTISQDVQNALLAGALQVDVPRRANSLDVFICSSESDMQMERAAIHHDLVAFLRPFCEQLQLDLRVVDPHYGLGSGTMALHADYWRRVRQEAELCLQRSVAVAFVCLIGDLYQTSVLPAEIREDEFTQLRTFLLQNMGSDAPAAARLIEKW